MKKLLAVLMVLGLMGCAPSIKDIQKKAEDEALLGLFLATGRGMAGFCTEDPVAQFTILFSMSIPAATLADQCVEIQKQGIRIPRDERVKVMKGLEDLQVVLCKLYDESVQQPNSANRCADAIAFNKKVGLCK